MGEKQMELTTPPIWHNEQDGVYGISKKEKLKQEIENSLLERMSGFINEKRSHYISNGHPEDDVNHVIVQAILDIPKNLLPLTKAKDELSL